MRLSNRPQQVLSTLERCRATIEPPNERWPVFLTLHAPTLVETAREGLRTREDLSAEDVEAIVDSQSTLSVLREYGFAPPAMTTDGARR